MNVMHPKILEITQRITERSSKHRLAYLEFSKSNYGTKVKREGLACTNLAHAIAAEDKKTKFTLTKIDAPNIAIVTAYNDMLSAHQPYYRYPERLKEYIQMTGATAQVAGGVPAMCDGVTQGQVGMELSLFSRDIIAQATAISLSHNMFDGVLALGICDKIVPGLLIGCLSFGHLPVIFVPAGPMSSGISNKEKANTRKLYAEGKVGKDALLDSEMKSYHSAGTCTFYGTANSNQMFMEIMGLHIPNSAFINPHTELRELLNKEAAHQITKITSLANNFRPVCEIVSEKTIVNAMVGLIATGGSTNHMIHLPAIAAAAGIIINWDDFHDLSKIVPLITRIYPNGEADINGFESAGGMAVVINELLSSGLLHNDVKTIVGDNLYDYAKQVYMTDTLAIQYKTVASSDFSVIRTVAEPFSKEGGLILLQGNLGRSVSKVSAIDEKYRYVKAPVAVFNNQEEVAQAYNNGKLNRDVVIVLRYQGPSSNGMPELHGLTPILASLQDQGFSVALVTDGRMSGASGKVPNAIHLTPEANKGGNIAKLLDGDVVELDMNNGTLNVLLTDSELKQRPINKIDLTANSHLFGRNLFNNLRLNVTSSELGATTFG